MPAPSSVSEQTLFTSAAATPVPTAPAKVIPAQEADILVPEVTIPVPAEVKPTPAIEAINNTNQPQVELPSNVINNASAIKNLNTLEALWNGFNKIVELVDYCQDFIKKTDSARQLWGSRISELSAEEQAEVEQLIVALDGLYQEMQGLSSDLIKFKTGFIASIFEAGTKSGSKIRIELTNAQGKQQEFTITDVDKAIEVIKTDEQTSEMKVNLIKADGSKETFNIAEASSKLKELLDTKATTELLQQFNNKKLFGNMLSHMQAITTWYNNNSEIVKKLDAMDMQERGKRKSSSQVIPSFAVALANLKNAFGLEEDNFEISAVSAPSSSSSGIATREIFNGSVKDFGGRIELIFNDIHKILTKIDSLQQSEQKIIIKKIVEVVNKLIKGICNQFVGLLPKKASQSVATYQALAGDNLTDKNNKIIEIIKEIVDANNGFVQKLKELENLAEAVKNNQHPDILSAKANLILKELKKSTPQAGQIRPELSQLGELINFNIDVAKFKDNCITILAQLKTDPSFYLTDEENNYILQSISSKIYDTDLISLEKVNTAIDIVRGIAKPANEKGLSGYSDIVRPKILHAITELEDLISSCKADDTRLLTNVQESLQSLRIALQDYPTEKAYLEVIITLKLSTFLEPRPSNPASPSEKQCLEEKSTELAKLLGLNSTDPDHVLKLYDLLTEKSLGKKDLFFQLMDEHFKNNKNPKFRTQNLREASEHKKEFFTTLAKEGHDKSLSELGSLCYGSSDNRINPHEAAIPFFRLAYLLARDDYTKNLAFTNYKQALLALKEMGKTIPTTSPVGFETVLQTAQAEALPIRRAALLAAELEVMKPKVGFSFFSKKEPATRKHFTEARALLLAAFSTSNDQKTVNECLNIAETLQKAAVNSQEKAALSDTVSVITDLITMKLGQQDSSIQPEQLLQSLQLLVTCCEMDKSLLASKQVEAKPQQPIRSEKSKTSFFTALSNKPVSAAAKEEGTLAIITSGLRKVFASADKELIDQAGKLLDKTDNLVPKGERAVLDNIKSEHLIATNRRQPSA